MHNHEGKYWSEGHFAKSILKDFPEFDDPGLFGVPIPVRFHYTGWKNAACPSFTDENRGEKIWIDWKDPGRRESDRPRFQLDLYDAETDQFEFDKWSDRLSVLLK